MDGWNDLYNEQTDGWMQDQMNVQADETNNEQTDGSKEWKKDKD